jgi:hypothetical protein
VKWLAANFADVRRLAALHKEGAGGEPWSTCGEVTFDPEIATAAIDNEISITIRGQEQVAIVMEALHKAGFVKAQAASPAGGAEQEPKL